MKKPAPICAPGWMSMPVCACASSATMRASSGRPEPVQLVRQAVVDHRQHAGVAQQHFVDAARGRVAVVGGQHVAVEQRRMPGRRRRKLRAGAAPGLDVGVGPRPWWRAL
jgi:hypothetical protein